MGARSSFDESPKTHRERIAGCCCRLMGGPWGVLGCPWRALGVGRGGSFSGLRRPQNGINHFRKMRVFLVVVGSLGKLGGCLWRTLGGAFKFGFGVVRPPKWG